MVFFNAQNKSDLRTRNGYNAEDLFQSFISAKSFESSNLEGSSNTVNEFYAATPAYTSSDHSDSPATAISLDLDSGCWHNPALSIERSRGGSPECLNHHRSIYHSPRQQTIPSNRRSFLLPIYGDHLDDNHPQRLNTETSTQSGRASASRSLNKPLSNRPVTSDVNCSKVKKRQRGAAMIRRASPYRASHCGTLWDQRLRTAAASTEGEAERPLSDCTSETSFSSRRSRSGGLDLNICGDQAVLSLVCSYDAIAQASPSSQRGYGRLQQSIVPVSTPKSVELDSPSLHGGTSHAEPQVELSSYPSSPLDPQPESLLLTPLTTGPMSAIPWNSKENPFMQAFASSTSKAGVWALTGDPSEVTCGGPAAAPLAGLDSSFAGQAHHNQSFGLEFDTYEPEIGMQGSQHHDLVHQQHTSPTPRDMFPPNRPSSAEYSTSALPSTESQSIFPTSCIPEQRQLSSKQISLLSRQQLSHTYPLSPIQMDESHNYRPYPPSSQTVGLSVSSSQPAVFSQPSQAGLSFPQPPRRSRPTPAKQRCKSANQPRRKSSNGAAGHGRPTTATNPGFVNFTPDDSKTILTGVAPSGSSKTKARREREAAERRRRLGEAAKRAVLDAGGNPEAVEREVLALGG